MIYRTIVETPIENELTDEKKKILAMKIEDIDLSIRSSLHLRRAGINTVADLVSKTEDDIMQLPHALMKLKVNSMNSVLILIRRKKFI